MIPTALLDKLHTGHQGISKCCERARQSIWWPGLSKQLEELVKCCSECCRAQNQRSEPLIPTSLPNSHGKKLQQSCWNGESTPTCSLSTTIPDSSKLLNSNVPQPKKLLSIPRVVSNNGPQYSSEAYAKFAQEFQFEHITSSPHYPQSNGES